MSEVVLTILAAWLVVAVLTAAACALVTRGGRAEDARRIRRGRRFRRDRSCLEPPDGPAVPRPRASVR